MSIYKRNIQTRGPLSRRVNKLKIFAANYHLITDTTDGDSWQVYGANFKWLYMRKKLNKHTIDFEVSRLKRITGLWDKLEFTYPKDKLGFIKIEFDTMISDQATNVLMNSANTHQALILLKKDALKKIDVFFQTANNPSKTCRLYKRKRLCKKAKIRRTFKYIKRAVAELKKMKAYYLKKQWKKYTEHYATFGKYMMKNQFIFNTFIDRMKRHGIKMQFKISGNQISTFKAVWD